VGFLNVHIHLKLCSIYYAGYLQKNMPQTYVRKDGARKYGYSNDAMQSAMKDVKENGMNVKKAAFLYGVNRTTRVTGVAQLEDQLS